MRGMDGWCWVESHDTAPRSMGRSEGEKGEGEGKGRMPRRGLMVQEAGRGRDLLGLARMRDRGKGDQLNREGLVSTY